jgi:hypothetical protein
MIRRSFIAFPALTLFTLATLSMMSSATQAVGTVTVTPTPTYYCPAPTPVPLWVEPVTSPTSLFTQEITVYLGHGEKVAVESEAGKFSKTGDFNDLWPAVVQTDLLPNTIHHLLVSGKVKEEIDEHGCVYGGYTLTTRSDRYGDPLIIQQVVGSPQFFPIIFSQP